MTVEHEATTSHPVPQRLLDAAQNPVPHVDSMKKYKDMWTESTQNPDKFFGNVSFEKQLFASCERIKTNLHFISLPVNY